MHRPPKIQSRDSRRGSALVLGMLSCIALVPMAGLAVDGTNVYLARNQLSSALNAAVLAGARSLSVGADLASQTASAQATALATFTANMSNSSAQGTPSFSVAQTSAHVRSVSGTVSATVPLMLMGLLGQSSSTINATATATRRDVNIVMVLDNSGSMTAYGSAPLAAMQSAALTFVNMFSNGRDNVGLVMLGTDPYVAEPLPNLNFQANVSADINGMTGPGNALTNTSAAMWAAYQQIQNLNQPGALNVIMLFTSSVPGAFTGNFAGMVTGTSYCDPTTSPLNGVLWSTQSQATIGGLADPTSTSINDTPEFRGASGCSADWITPDQFLTGMPTTDVNNNSTNGTGSIGAGPWAVTLNLNSITAQNITIASENALDDAANKIRNDATYAPVIYAIGLGGNPSILQPDPTFMQRIANDPQSAYYNSNQPAGLYIYAPTTADLQSAFSGIASQVLRLTK